jgi:hypothetical protein
VSGELRVPEAEELTPSGSSGVMEGGNPKVTAHVTVSPSGFKANGTAHFDAMHEVLIDKRAEPHFLYDPVTDRLGQYFPLNRSARALRNELNPDQSVKRRTNGSGLVNIQIEFVAWPGPITSPQGVTTQHAVFTDDWKPGPNYRAMMRAVRSWGVPDQWNGRLSKTQFDPVPRTWANYERAGWFGHCQVPGNDHWDPGNIDQADTFAAAHAMFFAAQEGDMQPEDLMDFDTVPSPMFPDNPTVSVRAALKFAMQWSLAGRNAAPAAARDAASGLEII